MSRPARGLMTLDDCMVHNSHRFSVSHVLPSICSQCGSHRTEVVGATHAPPTIAVRCLACGERSVMPVEDNDAPLHGADAVPTTTGPEGDPVISCEV